ncbi:MAG TPA: GNAT family N-acetyltransferase [Thermomicrobiales bacterium]|nr:GNAT family N-acetyltransferase [Thermomicrobiales bacterium]
MTATGGHEATWRAIRAVLAADCACAPEDFLRDGGVVTVARECPGRRRFPMPAKPLLLVTTGAGVVVSCHPERVDWARAALGPRPRDEIFSAPTIAELVQYVARDGQEIAGPHLNYTCAPADFRPAPTPEGVAITVVEREGIADLYQYREFRHALAYRVDDPRPDMFAAVATANGAIVGIAGVGADSDDLWQIGIDVVAPARGRGIGRALVGRLTEAIFRSGKVPYYATHVSNIHSRAIAVGLGYWPAWTEMHARDRAPGD